MKLNNEQNKIAIVMSGGGAKGAFQVGVLRELINNGAKANCYYGTSVGALNSAAMAYSDIDTLENIWLSIKGRSDILSFNFFSLLFKSGLYSMKPLRKKLQSIVKGFPHTEAKVCYTNLVSGEVAYCSNREVSNDEFIKFTEASAAIPCIMELPNDIYADGGVREQTPLKKAIDDGHDTIYLILCNPITQSPLSEFKLRFPKILSITFRALDLIEHEVYLNDIAVCFAKNQSSNYRKINLHVFAPAYQMLDTLEFDHEKIKKAILHGKEVAKCKLNI
jgi:NTE family protein